MLALFAIAGCAPCQRRLADAGCPTGRAHTLPNRAQARTWRAQLAIEHATTTVSAYDVAYAPGGHQLRDVSNPRCFETRYQSPQPFLAPLDELPWQPAYRVRADAPRRLREMGHQLRLFPIEDEQQTAVP